MRRGEAKRGETRRGEVRRSEVRRDEAKRSKVRQGRARVGFPRFRFARFLPAVVSGLRRVLLGFSPPFLLPFNPPLIVSLLFLLYHLLPLLLVVAVVLRVLVLLSARLLSDSSLSLSLIWRFDVVSSTSSLPPFFPLPPNASFSSRPFLLTLLPSLSLSFFLPLPRASRKNFDALPAPPVVLSFCLSPFSSSFTSSYLSQSASTLSPYYSLTLRPEARDATAKRAARTANYPPCRSTSCPPSTT